jgi:hypothetical protein
MNRDFEGIDYQKIGGGITAPLELSREERMKSLRTNAEVFIPEKDVTEVDERTGVHIQVAVKGVPMPMKEAEALGLVKKNEPKKAAEKPEEKEEKAEKPEEKSTEPAENKSKKPAENKSKDGKK